MNRTVAVRWKWMLMGGLLLLAGGGSSHAADKGKLIAPLYPGAVPAEGKSCAETSNSTACQLYSRDPIAKVKAFYDQKIGAQRFTFSGTEQGEMRHWAPLAWSHYVGEDGEGNDFPGVTLGSPAVPDWPASSAEAKAMIERADLFKELSPAVDWTEGADPSRRGLRTIKQMKDFYLANRQLLGRYFTASGSVFGDLKRKHSKDADDHVRAAERQHEQDRAAAQAKAEQGAQDFQSQATARQRQGPGAEEQADRKEMDALMHRKPALWAKAKPHYDKGQAAMGQGDMTTAQTEMEQANAILRSDPEVAALQDKQMARAQARAKAQQGQAMKSFSRATDMTGFEAADLKYNKARSDAIWNAWTQYPAEAAKLESFPTRIEVSYYVPGEGKDYSDKPAVVASKLQSGKRSEHGSRAKADEDAGTGSAKPAKNAGAAPARKQTPPADDAADSAKKAGKEGLKLLKKLF